MNFEFSFVQSIILFIIAASLIWYCCNKLSEIVIFIDDSFQIGSAFGGTIILALVTNLPEIAIVLSGSFRGDFSLAVGNILGGIVIQTVLLVIFDFANKSQSKPLSTLTNNKTSILQGLFLIIILAIVICGKQLKETILFARSTPPEILIVFVWMGSILAMKKLQNSNEEKVSKANLSNPKFTKKTALFSLLGISIIVLIFGIILERTSLIIAEKFKINGVIFGATILAFVTALPEISSGLAFVKNKTYKPIISDIFGGNAFLPVLFFPATLITNNAILPNSSKVEIYLTAISIIITSVYIIGMIISLPNKKFGLGYDSWIVLLTYIISIIGLIFI